MNTVYPVIRRLTREVFYVCSAALHIYLMRIPSFLKNPDGIGVDIAAVDIVNV